LADRRRSLPAMKHQELLRLVALLLISSNPCLSADEPRRDDAGESVIYDAAFYAPFAPRTALDMVKQTPGFVLADPEQELRRGFSGAVGNVLIDGQRLTAKSQTVADMLQRVPAGEVLRIEVLRGNLVAGDASGEAVLANVVRTAATGGGAWGLGFELANQDEPAPNGFFAWSGRRGVTEYSLGGNSYSLERDLPGTRSVYDAAGNLASRRFDASPREFAEYALNGQLARPLSGGRLTVTGQVAYSRYHDDSTLLTTSLTGAQIEDEEIPYTESDRVGEFGIGWQRAFGGWDAEVNALLTRKQHRNQLSVTHFDAADVLDSVFRRDVEQDSGESILRGTLARDLRGGRLETGAEIAVNTLDGRSHLTLDLGGGAIEIPVPNANLRVRENRAELFVSHSLELTPRWSFETRLAAEGSRLDFSGDTEQSVSLSYLKPRLQLTRTFGPHQVQLRAFRDVSQLDFTDFVSTVELRDETIDGGNPELRPQTAWAAELIGDFRYGATVWRARLFHHWLDEVKDLIPIVTPTRSFDAPGNIGRGTLQGAELNLRLPVAFLPGGTFSASGTLQHAQVRDPVTGEHRTISGLVERQLKAELRQDLQGAKVAWGVSFTGESAATTWRLLETDRKGTSSSLDLFIEGAVPFTQRGGLKLRLAMLSVLDDAETRLRRSYLPDRTGTFTGSEAGARQPGHRWLLSASGSF
jgi:hypothetical protein